MYVGLIDHQIIKQGSHLERIYIRKFKNKSDIRILKAMYRISY